MKRSVGVVLGMLISASVLPASTFTVTNTQDSGAGSLRQAILDANAHPGLDTIAFAIPGSGVQTILPLTPLDTITDPVVIDGYTQPGASPNTDPNGFNGTLLIEISGASAGLANGLNVSAGGSTVRGLVINHFSGTSAGAGNAIQLSQAGGNHIEGNFLGTDATGTAAAGIEDDALVFDPNSDGNFIGGSSPDQRNVISATQHTAFFIESSGNVIRGNFIGTQKDGVSPLGNVGGIGFAGGFNGDNDNVIGGPGPGDGNVIAFNVFGGVGGEVASGTGNSIRGNSIHDNGTLGIDWLPQGPTPNDPGDADTGMNQYQNFPIIQSATTGASTHVVAKLDSTPSTTFDVDFYANPACSNFPREFLEGETYLGSTQVSTDGSGHATIDVVLPAPTEPGARISATATDPAGNTSEFSQRIIFSMTPASGPSAGGTALSIAGTDFANPTTVTIGGSDASPGFADDHTLTATSPALPPGTVNDVVAMTPDGTTGTLVKGWVSDFLDVDGSNQFYTYVTTLVSNGITVGVGGGLYGVDAPTLRQQMAVFILKAEHGLCYTPPPCVGIFADVPCSSNFAPWIEAMANEGITTGCGGGNFCPTNPVRRDQMAVFLLKGEHGSSYLPPHCQGIFGDVTCPSTFADWIEQLANEQITSGCGGGNYCPAASNTRGQMAVFLTKTFGLQ